VAEPIETIHLLGGITTDRIRLGQVRDQLLDPRPELIRELRCRRPDEGVDVVADRVTLVSS
jgi:hypothetical protein